MTSLAHPFADPALRSVGAPPVVPSGYLIEDHETGYMIRPLHGVPVKCLVLQLLAMIFGALLATLAIVLLVIAPAQTFAWWMLASAASFLAALGLMRFAGRGLSPRIDVDLVRGEVRELALDRTGGVTVLSRHAFDRLGAVHIERAARRPASLCIRFRDRPGRLEVTRGEAAELEGLRNRLGRDLMKDPAAV